MYRDLTSARAQSRLHVPGIAGLAVGTARPAVVEGCTAAAESGIKMQAKVIDVFPTRTSEERTGSRVRIVQEGLWSLLTTRVHHSRVHACVDCLLYAVFFGGYVRHARDWS